MPPARRRPTAAPLATFLARQCLFVGRLAAGSGPPSIAPTAGSRAGKILTVTDASVCLMAQRRPVDRRPAPTQAEPRLLRRGQSDDGGWGPRVSSPPEPFDTALVLLGLAKCDQSPEVRGMIVRGRALPGRPATGRWKLDRDDPAAGQRQLRPADLDHRLGDARAPGDPRVTRAQRPGRDPKR